MGSTEHIERVTDLRVWPGDFPVSHLYTMGVAGERFFRELKDGGRFLGTRCAACDHVHVPPSIFCPRCFAALDEWKEVGPQGTVRAVTIAHRGVEGETLDPPEALALVQLDGANDLLVHRVGGAQGVEIGTRVEPVFKDPAERTGSILDVRYFRRA
jgi:uncharacterized OB-fold protein